MESQHTESTHHQAPIAYRIDVAVSAAREAHDRFKHYRKLRAQGHKHAMTACILHAIQRNRMMKIARDIKRGLR